MKRFLLAVVMVFMLVNPAVADAPINVVVDGKALSTPGLVIDNTTYAPIRAVADAFGATTEWQGDTVSIRISARPIITGGDSISRAITNQALDILSDNDPADYEMVCRYTKEIIISNTKINTPKGLAYAITAGYKTFELSPTIFTERTPEYIAAALVHEACHLCNNSGEKVAYLRQIATLRILGASQKDIDDEERTLIRALQK